MKRLITKTLRRFGYDLTRYSPPTESVYDPLPDVPKDQKKIISLAKPFTMTSPERLAALVGAVNYIAQNNIPGDIAECGVWRGGSMMAVALSLLAKGDTSRSLYLYDTFEGMSAPTDVDKSLDGDTAESQLQKDPKGTGVWCYAAIEDVKRNLLSTGYPEEKIHLIKGKVEDTIPQTIAAQYALLRLDTDWYESTRHELIHLYPRLNRDGIMIIDDYGHWQGARKAVDEYFEERRIRAYLHRIDYTGRIFVKTQD